MVATARIAAEHASFNRIRQVAPVCTPSFHRANASQHPKRRIDRFSSLAGLTIGANTAEQLEGTTVHRSRVDACPSRVHPYPFLRAGGTPPVRGLALTGPPNKIFGKCKWTPGMKIYDYMLV